MEICGKRAVRTEEMGFRIKTIKIEAESMSGRINSSGKGPTLGKIQNFGAEFKIPVTAIIRLTIKTKKPNIFWMEYCLFSDDIFYFYSFKHDTSAGPAQFYELDPQFTLLFCFDGY